MKRLLSTLLITSVMAASMSAAAILPAAATDSFEPIEIYKAENGYFASAGVTADEGKTYRYMAATYDSDKKLVNVTLAASEAASADKAAMTAAFPADVCAGGSVKFMLWADDGSLQPAASAVTVTADSVASLPELKEVAAGKPNGFGGEWGDSSATCLTDGKTGIGDTTLLTIAGAGKDMYGYIDLGAAYRIAYIEVMTYDPNDGAGSYKLSVTNEDPKSGVPSDKTMVAQEPILTEQKTEGDGYLTYSVPQPAAQEPNRYVMLEKATEANRCFVQEVKVYVLPEDELQFTEVAQGKTNGWGVNAGGDLDYKPTPGNLLTDGDLITAAGDINPFEGEYVYIDLGERQKISHFEIVAYAGIAAGNFDIYLTNADPAGGVPEDKALVGDVPYTEDAKDVAAGTSAHYVPAEYAGQAYRYIVLARKNAPGRFMVQEVKAYVNSADIRTYTNVAAGKPNGYGPDSVDFAYPPTFNGGNRLTDGSTDETLAVTDYDSEDGSEYVYIDLVGAQKLAYLKIVAYGPNGTGNFNIYLTNTNPAGGVPQDKILVGSVPSGAIATAEEGTTIHSVPAEYADQAYSYIVLARASAAGRFVVNEVEAYVDDAELRTYTNVAFGKPESWGTDAGESGAGFDYYPGQMAGDVPRSITDGLTQDAVGDTDTAAGDQGEYISIDLGAGQKISYFKIVAYDPVGAGGGNFDVYLTNTKPTGGIPEGAVKVAAVPSTQATTAAEGTSVHYVPAENAAQEYQYIMVKRASDARFTVQELEAYVLQ